MIPIEFALPTFVIGVLFLYKGSDILVDGTAKTAAKLGVSALIISLVVVAFGTSAPEFAISFGAALQNYADISIGNIIGSCIANLLLVLGLSAIVRPIHVEKGIIKREMPILLGSTALFLVVSFFGLLDTHHKIGGLLFLVVFMVFICYCIRCAKKERSENREKYDLGALQKNILFIVLGIVGVILGAWFLIESAVTIADFLGIPKLIIALSMVAIGTSLPELVVSATAAYKNEADIAVGNVIGSNIFNIYLILGAAALLIPLNAFVSLHHIVFLLVITAILIPILYTGYQISRKEGIVLLGLYSVYIWYLFFV